LEIRPFLRNPLIEVDDLFIVEEGAEALSGLRVVIIVFWVAQYKFFIVFLDLLFRNYFVFIFKCRVELLDGFG
jgi:hypothetical protein